MIAEEFQRALLVHQQGGHADALAICAKILKQSPEHIETLVLSADLAAKCGDADRALQTYQKVLDLKPGHVLAHYKCGNLFRDRGLLTAALASYDEAIALDPK
jgi:tetratricopeptide (TPR) repeat protein